MENQYNVDQIPLPFSSCPSKVIDDLEAEQMWVSTLRGATLEKWQCSLIVTIWADSMYF